MMARLRFAAACALAVAFLLTRLWAAPGAAAPSAALPGASAAPQQHAPVLPQSPTRAATISAGGQSTCTVTTTGAVLCWGDNRYGQLGDGTTLGRGTPAVVTGLSSGAAQVASGGWHACALLAGGGVKCWGANGSGQLADAGGGPRLTPLTVSGLAGAAVSLAAGDQYTCAVVSGGAVQCWGDNTWGQLGDGTTTNRTAPASVVGLTGVVSIAAGAFHACALTSGGGVKCWGSNGYGQLGDGTFMNSSAVPVDVVGLTSGVTAVTAGDDYTCAVTAAGGVKCWGVGWYGQMGDGTISYRPWPGDVVGLTSGAVAVTARENHTCAILGSGAVKCWGRNEAGEIGDGTTTDRLSPVDVTGLDEPAVAISGGYQHTCALAANGSVHCWGQDMFGQLGVAGGPARLTPVDVVGLSSGVSAIGAFGPSCALTTASGVECWGPNGSGQLGDGTTISRATAAGVNGLSSGVAKLSVGLAHSCVVKTSGGVQCWGTNMYGEVGNGTLNTVFPPVDVTGLSSGAAAVSAGGYHTCAVTSGGAARCWGYNYYGALGDGTTTDRSTPVDVTGLSDGVSAVATGWIHSCALTSTGGVKCWGRNSGGQLGDGTTTDSSVPVAVSGLQSGVVAIAAGGFQSCALTSGGAVACWGGTFGVRPAPIGGLTSGVATISVGNGHVCAVTTSGGAKCVGRNAYGQLGDGTAMTRDAAVDVVGLSANVAAIAAGETHTCARTTSGGVKCWGENTWGQVGDGRASFSTVALDVVGFGPTQALVSVVVSGALIYDGTAKPVTVTTLPVGLPVSVTYTGIGATTYGPSALPPVDVGTYSVVATVTDPDYDGSTTVPLTINNPTPAIARVTPAELIAGAGPCLLTVTGSSFVRGAVVVVNGVPQRSTTYVSSTEIRANVSPDATGIVSVVVLNPAPTLGPSPAVDLTVHVSQWDGITISIAPSGTPNPVRSGGTAVLSFGAADSTGHEITYTWSATCPWASSNGTFADAADPAAWTAPPNTTHMLQNCVVQVVVDDLHGHTRSASYTQAVAPGAGRDFDGDGSADLAVFRPSTGEWLVKGRAGTPVLGHPNDVPVPGDYNGDGRLELAVFRPATGEWLIENEATVQWGQMGDIPAPGDYNGDGGTEIAVYRPATGEWLVMGEAAVQWGTAGDVPVPADYNGDGVTEMAVYRPWRGDWWVRGAAAEVTWGRAGDVPVPADYNGDGKDEIAVYRPATGEWLIQGVGTVQWGQGADVPVPLDTNGDGAAEIVVFTPATGTWSIRYAGASDATSWGRAGDVPIGRIGTRARFLPTDFDGDGRPDMMQFDSATAQWVTRLSSTGAVSTTVFGQPGDIAVPGDYQGTRVSECAVFRPTTAEWHLADGRVIAFGQAGDVPVPGDYDGDGIMDIAVARPGLDGYVLTSSSGYTESRTYLHWGPPGGFTPAPADYDGDGVTDYALFVPIVGRWFVYASSAGLETSQMFTVVCGPTARPMPADYDGDGRADITVFNPSDRTWRIATSTSGYAQALTWSWGESGDVPAPIDYEGDGRTEVAVYRPSTSEWLVRERAPVTMGTDENVPATAPTTVPEPAGVPEPAPSAASPTPQPGGSTADKTIRPSAGGRGRVPVRPGTKPRAIQR